MEIERKVGRHHLAFYRGWLQGLNLSEIGDRYLETGIDLRRAKACLSWLRDVIQQAARRHGKHGMARLLRLNIQVAVTSGLEQTAATLPSLAQFREEFDPHTFYTEKELIQAYTQQYPHSADDKAHRRHNMIDRQLRALSWVEELLATEPQPADLVSAWFDRSVANRLMLGGIPNLYGLTALIRERGNRWWVSVPKLGPKGGARIVRWLQTYESSLGTLPVHALKPLRSLPAALLVAQRPCRTAIVPIDSLLIPSDLDGSRGLNRYGETPKIDAADDMQAIRSWLAMKSASPHTQVAYRKEAERLVLWAIIERRKALSDLSVNDCAAYRDWLSMIGRTDTQDWPFRVPQEDWLRKGKIGSERHSNQWRPFGGPLSVRSVKQAIGILNGLFGWLVKVQYLAFNPWAAVSMTLAHDGSDAPDLELTRALTKGQWSYLQDYLEQRAPSDSTEQLRFALQFAYVTGMRRAELVDAKTSRLYSMPLRDEIGTRWMLKVLGKGNKWRTIPMPDKFMESLANYLEYRGLSRDPIANPPDTPLIAHQSSNAPLTQSMLYKAFKSLFAEVASKLEHEGKSNEAKVFRKASTHWLRHTRGSHLGASGTAATMIQKLLGHASVATTSIYTKVDDEVLWAEMSK